MKIDEACINHNVVRMIDEVIVDPYVYCSDETDAKRSENYNCMLMSIGEINGILAMASAMKEVLKA